MTYTMIFRRLLLLLMILSVVACAPAAQEEPPAEPLSTPITKPTDSETYPAPDTPVVDNSYPAPVLDNSVQPAYPDPIDNPTLEDDGRGGEIREAGTIETLEVLLLESFPLRATAAVAGYFPNGCWSLADVTAEQVDAARFVVTVFGLHAGGDVCTEALVPFEETVDLPINQLPAGVYTVEAGEQTATFELQVDNMRELPDPKPNIQIGQADVTDVSVVVDEAAGVAEVTVLGYLRDGCTNIQEIVIGEVVDGTLSINITTARDANMMCTMALVDYEEVFELALDEYDVLSLTLDVNGFIVAFQ